MGAPAWNGQGEISKAAFQVLQSTFGFSSFRPHQDEIIRCILSSRDVFAALPTGGGKSLCYQLPSLLLPGLTVVVSPLIALMQDQVDAALQAGLTAAFLNSTQRPEEARKVWNELRDGRIRLLYVSPERLAIPDFRNRLRSLPFAGGPTSLFAIDEAHCISEWGHEFRPDYRTLGVLRNEFPEVPIAAFTATATARVQADVIRLLGLAEPHEVRASFDRKEIFYRVRRKARAGEQIVGFVHDHPYEPGIIYRATRKSVEQTAQALARSGIAAEPYHAGLSDQDRRETQRRFVRDEIQVVVATIAFGMGIDKSNVRWIVHGDLPRSLEAYYQETGRAGRDGEAAEALLLYGPQDLATNRYHIDRMEIDSERERAQNALNEMHRFASAGVCRRIGLLAHFDEPHAGACGACDNCTTSVTATDRSVDAQKAMSAMVRTGQRFGSHHIADIVCGIETDRVLQFGHDHLPTFGVGSETPRPEWLSLIADLEAAALVARTDGARSGLALTPAGKEVLAGRESFVVRVEAESEQESAGARQSRASRGRLAGYPPSRDAAPDESPADEELYARLRELRTRLAREQSVPPYVVFSDRSLRDMVRLRPGSLGAFLNVHGVGAKKAERYAEDFLQVIRSGA